MTVRRKLAVIAVFLVGFLQVISKPISHTDTNMGNLVHLQPQLREWQYILSISSMHFHNQTERVLHPSNPKHRLCVISLTNSSPSNLLTFLDNDRMWSRPYRCVPANSKVSIWKDLSWFYSQWDQERSGYAFLAVTWERRVRHPAPR